MKSGGNRDISLETKKSVPWGGFCKKKWEWKVGRIKKFLLKKVFWWMNKKNGGAKNRSKNSEGRR